MANDATSLSKITRPKSDFVLKNGVIYTIDKIGAGRNPLPAATRKSFISAAILE